MEYRIRRALIVLALSLTQHSHAAQKGKYHCVAETLANTFIKPNAALFADFDKKTKYFYWGRLQALIRTIPQERLKAISDLSLEDFRELFFQMKSGEFEHLTGPHRAQVNQLIEDLYVFLVQHENHGDWLRSENVSDEFLKRLDLADKKAGFDNSLTSAADFTESALEVNERQLFERALGEYKGRKFNRTATRRAWDAWRRFWFPTHKRADAILDFDRVAREQMQLEGFLDKIVREQGMGKLAEHGIDAAGEKALQAYLADTPAAVAAVRRRIAKVWGQELSESNPIALDKLDIKAIYQRLEKFDPGKQELKVQTKVETDLDGVQEILNDARKQKGLAPRTVKDFAREELQIRYQQRERVGAELQEEYGGAISRNSQERYTVEDQRTRDVPDGEDEKGNTKYRTETYYEDRTVYPTYNNIIGNSWDMGDRYVSGLDAVKANTEAMRVREAPYRNLIEATENEISGFNAGYPKVIKDKQKVEQKIAELIQLKRQLDGETANTRAYSQWTDSKINQQWDKDQAKDFRDRNGTLAERFSNMSLHIENIIEQTRRQLASLNPEFVHPNYDEQMAFLRKKMIFAHSAKGVGGTAIVGLGAWYYVENQQEVDDRIHRIGVKLGLVEDLSRGYNYPTRPDFPSPGSERRPAPEPFREVPPSPVDLEHEVRRPAVQKSERGAASRLEAKPAGQKKAKKPQNSQKSQKARPTAKSSRADGETQPGSN